MIKKLTSLLLSVCVLASCLTGIVFAEEVSPYLINYDANVTDASKSGYVDASASTQYGIQLLNNCWGFANELKLGRQGFRFSPKDVNAGETETVYGQFTFADDTKNNPSALNSATATYAVEMEISSVVRAQGGKDGHYYYTLKGTDEQGNPADAVRIHVYGTGTNGKMTVEGAAGAKTIDVVLDASGEPAELYYLRIYVDMETQAYSVWAVKRGDANGYSATEPTEDNLLIAGQSLKTKITSLTGATFGAVNTFKDKVYVHFMRISETEESVTPGKTDAERAQEDLDAIDLGDMSAVTANFTLPTTGSVNNSAITWASDNAAIAISGGTATVVRPSDADAEVTLTATATLNEAKPTKAFAVTVKKAETVVPDKTDAEKAQEDLNAINLGDMSAVTANFTLPTTGSVNNSAITWASDNAAIAISGGTATVVRPSDADAKVTLTATATLNEAKTTKTFAVTVKKEEKPIEEETTVTAGTNLALKKAVSAYDKNGAAIAPYSDSFGYEQMVDGDNETRMAQKDWTDYSGSAIQIDLGKKYRFNTITMREFAHRLVRYKYQYSNDGKTWTDIGEERRQTGSTASPNVHEDYHFPSVDARYVRIYVLENWNNNGNKVGLSIFEMGVYFYPAEVLYNPNLSENAFGYVAGDAAALQKYGINVAAVSPDRWAGSVKAVETDISGLSGKKGISVEPRNGQTDTTEGAKLLAGSVDFTKNTQNKPLAMSNMNGGYVIDMEFSNYIRQARQANQPGLWEYQFKGLDANGAAQTFAILRTVLPPNAATENGALTGYAEMADADNTARIPLPLRTSNNATKAPHVSFVRIYVDLKNQTYSAWLVKRGDLSTAYSEKMPTRAELLIMDQPFAAPITQLTGVETYSQNTHNDKSFITLLHAYEMDGAVMAQNAAASVTVEDILGDNPSADAIGSALQLMRMFQNTQVSWTSAPENIISEDGAIIQAPSANTKVTLTAVFERDGKTAAKSFDVTVLPSAEIETDEVKVRLDYEALTLGDTSAVTGNLILPASGSKRGSSISWKSSNPSVIDPATGTVTRPEKGVTVTLTATVSFGNVVMEKEFAVTVLGTMASKKIEGIDGTYFTGGMFYQTEQMNFIDYFEGDGSNGTNGTVPWEKDGVTEGLKAEKADQGIRFSRAGATGANPGRGAVILEQTYTLPQLEDLKKAYYMELECAVSAGGQVLLDFGQEGDASVVRINKTDGGNGAKELYQYETEETVRTTGTYTAGQNVTFGIYIMPELKEMVLYQNGKKLADSIYSYSDPQKSLSTLKVTWKQNLQWYNIPASEFVWLKSFHVYEGEGISAETAIGLDKDALTLGAITDEKANEITGDLNLYTEGKFGSTITWSSSDPSVINPATGAVIRPESDKAVTLTATLKNGDKTEQVVFELVVQRKMTVNNILIGSSVKIENGSSIEDIGNLTDGNYNTFIETLDAGKKPVITVNIGSEKAISTVVLNGLQGTVKTAVEISTDGKTWTEVGVVSGSGDQRNLSFLPVMAQYIRLSVKEMAAGETVRISELEAAMNASDADIVEADKKLVKAFDEYNVTASAVLPTKGVFGSDITWKSSAPNVVSDKGEFTKPLFNTPFTMTAYLSYGSAKGTSVEQHLAIGSGSGGSGGGGGGSVSGSSGGSGGKGGAVGGSGALVSLAGTPSDNNPSIEPVNPNVNSVFADVAADNWAYDYIKTLKEAKVVNGDESGLFRPLSEITREEYLKLLVEALKIEVNTDAQNSFADVNTGDWFAPYVGTAAAIGLVNGVTETQFGVGQTITRQDMAVMTKRALDLQGITLTAEKETVFADMGQIADYAAESVTELAAAEILNGDENGYFNPNASALREQAAKIICMVMQKNAK